MASPKKVLTISGSSRAESSNVKLLKALQTIDGTKEYIHFDKLNLLPVFAAESDQSPWPVEVLNWREALSAVDAVVICTPEYLHNLPGQIKSALEWIVSSGELVAKPTIAITYTPNEPRGERAMQSLLWSLSALDARVVAQLNIFQSQIKVDRDDLLGDQEIIELLSEALRML